MPLGFGVGVALNVTGVLGVGEGIPVALVSVGSGRVQAAKASKPEARANSQRRTRFISVSCQGSPMSTHACGITALRCHVRP